MKRTTDQTKSCLEAHKGQRGARARARAINKL